MIDWSNDPRVALTKDLPQYPQEAPYNPSEKLPEWPNLPISEENNPVYRSIRQLFYYLQLDIENYGKSTWNPLGKIIQLENVEEQNSSWLYQSKSWIDRSSLLASRFVDRRSLA